MKFKLFKSLLLLLGVSLPVHAEIPTSKNQEYIDNIINFHVKSGLTSIKDIEEITISAVVDNGFEEEFSKKWIKSRIKQAHVKVLSQSKNWIVPTDVSRLIKAFDELNQEGIIAFHNAGYTTTDGFDNIREVLQLRKKKHIKVSTGYCFYHQQDLERAMDADMAILSLSFGSVSKGDEKKSIEIGKQIVKVLKKYHFKVNWNKTQDKKIEILNFKWQNLYDSTIDLSEDAQIEILG